MHRNDGIGDWAVDGQQVAGVWSGRPDGTPVPDAFGGNLAAPILFEAFDRLKPALDRLPLPPLATRIVANSELPQPLQQFRARNAVFAEVPKPHKLSFHPDAATISADGNVLMVKGARTGPAPIVEEGFTCDLHVSL